MTTTELVLAANAAVFALMYGRADFVLHRTRARLREARVELTAARNLEDLELELVRRAGDGRV